MSSSLIPGYQLCEGSGLDRAKLVKFMQLTYQEIYPGQDFSHLAKTAERYFSQETPLWWVDFLGEGEKEDLSHNRTVACLWMGNAIDQLTGNRHAHIFLLYVVPAHRRKGIGTALMHRAEDWARARGDHQMGLQVFEVNQPALNLYHQLGYETQSLWMIKPL